MFNMGYKPLIFRRKKNKINYFNKIIYCKQSPSTKTNALSKLRLEGF